MNKKLSWIQATVVLAFAAFGAAIIIDVVVGK
jgi:hypothetical protein